MVTPDFQEPLLSSGEEESLILAEKQESQETPSPALGVPTLTSRPSLETKEVWLSSAVPFSSSLESGTSAGMHSKVTPASPTPERRGRFKGLNGRHFQQQESRQGREGRLEVSAQPPTPELAGNHVEPLLATRVTDSLGSGRSQSPWAVLSNEVDVPGAGEWCPRRRWDLSGCLRGAGGGGSES